MYYKLILLLLAIIQNVLAEEFNPLVSAHCERGYMTINVITKHPFNGIIHTRDFRNNSLCSVTGTAARNTTLRISAVAVRGEPSFCGVAGTNQDADEQRQVAIAVRTHRSIELSDDKYFLITCAQSSYFNTQRKVRSRVRLSILHPEDPSKSPPTRLIMGNQYTMRAQLSEPDKEHRLFLKHCIAFSQLNATETLLIDDHGCSADSSIISQFNYSVPAGEPVDAAIRSMFKFPDVYRVHIQCDAVLCRQSAAHKCARKYACSLREPRLNGLLHEEEVHHRVDDGFGPEDEPSAESTQDEIHIVAATTVYVLEPDQELLDFVKRAEECNEWRYPWLVGLCAVLGALLAVMFIVNICLCTSLTCTCTKQDVLEKEDGSELADYDPYKIDFVANNSHLYTGNSLPRHYHSHFNGDYQEELDYNNSLGHQRPSSRYSSSAPSYKHGGYHGGGYHNYGYR